MIISLPLAHSWSAASSFSLKSPVKVYVVRNARVREYHLMSLRVR